MAPTRPVGRAPFQRSRRHDAAHVRYKRMEGGFIVENEEDDICEYMSRPHGVPPPRRHVEDEHDEEGEAALAALEAEQDGVAPPSRSAASSSSGASASTATVGKCVECRDATGQTKFFDAFGMSVCYACQRAAQGAGGKYQVITKSKAKDEFLLTDRQLDASQGGLGCMTRPNPHDSRYGDMRLFLRSQAEEVALQTWGSDEALFLEKERRSSERLQKAEARKRKAADSSSAYGPSRGGSKAKAAPKRAAAAVARSANTAHTHTFLPDETYDEETDEWTKRCACGFAVTYEKI